MSIFWRMAIESELATPANRQFWLIMTWWIINCKGCLICGRYACFLHHCRCVLLPRLPMSAFNQDDSINHKGKTGRFGGSVEWEWTFLLPQKTIMPPPPQRKSRVGFCYHVSEALRQLAFAISAISTWLWIHLKTQVVSTADNLLLPISSYSAKLSEAKSNFSPKIVWSRALCPLELQIIEPI